MQQHRFGSGGRGGGTRRAGRHRSRRSRTLLLGLLSLAVLVAGSVSVHHWFGTGLGTSYAAAPAPRSGHAAAPAPAASRHPAARRAPHPSASPTPPTPATTRIPETGPGTFVTAQADGATVGHGRTLLRYMVEIEKGIGIAPEQAANEIAGILAAPRGWTRNGVSSFRLVSSGPHDLKVMIATPGTADALCWQGIHQDTGGEYDCEVPGGVVVNLKRWIEGSPTFDGPIHDYRALIINHEMGHFLGHQHEGCPGPGRPAPVMMQQIKGLHGCVANAWPYDDEGHYLSGPPQP
ncbi:DUF3152 domain-containing protein [Streptomyces sulfonofaciens]|nr:DUF3152 domain-containing protein [Streptomyces sulfonofaciens]